MPKIYVDIDEMRWQITLLEIHLGSIRSYGQRRIAEALQMATGYDGQLQRQVMAIAGHDESLVRTLANDVEGLIFRLKQITDAFEAADGIRGLNPALGTQLMRLIDGGLLLSSTSWRYQRTDELTDLERRLWSTRDAQERAVLLAGGGNGYLEAFARSGLLPPRGSEADLWKAFQVFLFVSGAIDTQPSLETWRTAANASGMELDAYVAAGTGVKQQHVEAWFHAAETHDMGLETAIGEIVDMARAGETIEEHFGFAMEGNWTEGDKDDMVEGVLMVAHALTAAAPDGASAGEVFRGVFDEVTFELQAHGAEGTWWCTASGQGFACEPLARNRMSPQLVAHELGHTFNAMVYNNTRDEIRRLVGVEQLEDLDDELRLLTPYEELKDTQIVAQVENELLHVSGRPLGGGYERTDLGYASLGPPWQYHSIRFDSYGNTAGEDFADMFLGWAFHGFADDPAGAARHAWVANSMSRWIARATGPLDPEALEMILP